jgi:hypothetical protein
MPDSSANALQESVEAADIDDSRCCIGKCGAQKNVVWFVLVERVVDQIGRHPHLPSGLLLSRMTSLDQA